MLSLQIPDMKMHHTEYNTALQKTGKKGFFPLASSDFQVLDPEYTASL